MDATRPSPLPVPGVSGAARRSVADLSFAQPKELASDELSAFVRGLGLEHLESFRCLDRYEGPGVDAGKVKTTMA